jgi:hypothetical protein
MRSKRSRVPSIAAFASDPKTVPGGATRAAEPELEQIALEAHARALMRVGEHDGPANWTEHWLTN